MSEPEVRKRKQKTVVTKAEYENYVNTLYNKQVKKELPTPSRWSNVSLCSCLVGVVLMVICGLVNAWYLSTLHENTLWFTNIQEVEREISFRTESGLFYSYYKQLVNSKSISKGIDELVRDNLTEYPSTINVLQRMNIYQEVILAGLSKFLAVKIPPIFFYANFVFGLQAVLVGALFFLSWMLSDNCLTGVLTAIFYAINRDNTTRVEFTLALRECFALPFLWVQIAAISYFFRKDITRGGERLVLLFVGSSTFLFCLCWQFNQFIMLLQAFSLFGVWVLEVVPPYKIRRVMFMQLLSFLTLYYLQYFNPMIIGGLFISFIAAFYILMFIRGNYPAPCGVVYKLFKVISYSIAVLILTFIINTTIKWYIELDADEHIYKFVLNKVGYGNPRDFDSRLYLCLDIFRSLPAAIYIGLSRGVIFPIYVIAHTVLLTLLVLTVLSRWSSNTEKKLYIPEVQDCLLSYRPELCFHAIQAVMFGILAITTMRMKYLWTPYMCVLAGYAIGDMTLWKTLLSFTSKDKIINVVRYTVCLTFIGSIGYLWMPSIQQELSELKEFWDPDTVELMQWINKNTAKTASFSGSMQLLAGVKLCTGRPITNHPHYEDKDLRDKTKQIYQIYGRREPGDIYNILKKYKTHYIILEDSICLSHNTDYCALPDIIDLVNGMIPDKGKAVPGLIESKVPRFCDIIRYNSSKYSKYFKSVFTNKTFRIYRLL
ncbi:probable C-mannosyltransferase DPY19L3 [Patella vulgata]|uniref:probable C-mannosyltransferase DPY19L3 n=1 Tax=Patella vulgata TaxID=6465 RepID=UPI0024A9F6F7|nr:probable C-mannosyltransferase DPY19L3 [Patella vulgata]XP_050394569.2 probable C-mannosyltransferase DPY19L3 [Patella vulgata]